MFCGQILLCIDIYLHKYCRIFSGLGLKVFFVCYFFFAFHTFTLKGCIWLVNEFVTSTNQINHILIIGFPPLKPFLFVCIFMLISIFFTTMDIPVFCDHASWHLSSRYCSNAHDRDRLNPRDHDPSLPNVNPKHSHDLIRLRIERHTFRLLRETLVLYHSSITTFCH